MIKQILTNVIVAVVSFILIVSIIGLIIFYGIPYIFNELDLFNIIKLKFIEVIKGG